MLTITARVLCFSLAVLFASSAVAAPLGVAFSIDPASPANQGSTTSDDVLGVGPIILQSGSSLGMKDDFATGDYDNMDALSYGNDPIQAPIFFSVDRVATGLPGSAVHAEASPGVEEAAGDVYQPAGGSNLLILDETQLGLMPAFFGDDVDALTLQPQGPLTYFSVDLFSATNLFGAGYFADDIFASKGNGAAFIYAEGETDIGLLPGDDLDALVLFDILRAGEVDKHFDVALFSLSAFSPSTFTYTGNTYAAGVQGALSPADILMTDFSGTFWLAYSAASIGLEAADELDALATMPEPGSLALLLTGLLIAMGGLRPWQRRNLRAIVVPVALLMAVWIVPHSAMAASSDPLLKYRFDGYSPPNAMSIGTLALSPMDNDGDNLFDEDAASGGADGKDKIFRWRSQDAILGPVDTGLVTATIWNLFPATATAPARLVFSGNKNGVMINGDVLFDDYLRGVVDIVKSGKRIRYLVKTIFMDEPRTTETDFRPAPFGVFRTLAPTIKIPFAPSQVRVLIDDADDTTDDGVFIENFFVDVLGEGIASLPETVLMNSVQGGSQINLRILPGHEGESNPPIRLFGFGQNRIRIMSRSSSSLAIDTFTLHYRLDDEGVVGPVNGVTQLPNAEIGVNMIIDHVVVDFSDSTSDKAVSDYFRERHIRPQGVVRDLGVLQGRPELFGLSDVTLVNSISHWNNESASGKIDVTPDIALGDPRMSSEAYPAGIIADYAAATNLYTTARTLHYHHFVLNTFAAHRLIDRERAANAAIRVISPGSGVGDTQNFSATPNARTELMLSGARLPEPTDIVGEFTRAINVAADGDLRRMRDDADHDTSVFTILAGDGIGNVPQNATRIILGTGTDARIRSIKTSVSYLAYLSALETSKDDATAKIHQIERSYNTRTGTQISGEQRNDVERRYKAIIDSGKLIVGAAWNEGLTGGLAENADAGRIGPDNNVSRKDLAGDNAFRKNVLVVGASTEVTAPNAVERAAGFSNRGRRVSVVAPGENIRALDRGAAARGTNGTSFSTPIVTGIVAELLLIRPDLQAKEKMNQALQYIEATAEDIEAVGRDNDVGNGRVSYWKAVLSAINTGLSEEGRTSVGGFDNFFKDLPLINWKETIEYGFELRTRTRFAVVWLHNKDGSYAIVRDAGGTTPDLTAVNVPANAVSAYISTQPRRNAGGRVLPDAPFSAAQLTGAGFLQRFVARFSIDRIQLLGNDVFNPVNDRIELWAPGVDPANPGANTAIVSVPLNIEEMRKANASTIPAIRDRVTEFDDYVFYITAD